MPINKEKFLQVLKDKNVDDDMLEDMYNYFNERTDVKLTIQQFRDLLAAFVHNGRITIDNYIEDKLIELEINQLVTKEGIIYL